jgi:hypothetical protein
VQVSDIDALDTLRGYILMFILVVHMNCLYFLRRVVLCMVGEKDLHRVSLRVRASVITSSELVLLLKGLGPRAI